MSSRFFLGTVAIAAGAVIYEKNKRSHQLPDDLIINRQGVGSSNNDRIPTDTSLFTSAGKHADSSINQLNGKINNVIDGAEDRYAKAQQPPTVTQSLKDDYSNIKEGLLDDATSLKNAIFRTSDKTRSEIKADLKHAQKSNYDGGKTTFGTSPTSDASRFKWGDTERLEETRALLVNQYDEANKKYNELRDELHDHAERYKDNYSKQSIDYKIEQAKNTASELKQKLDASAKEFKEKIHQDANELSDKIYNSQLGTLIRENVQPLHGEKDSKISYSDEEKLARNTMKGLHGWGDTASELSEEQYQSVKENQPVKSALESAKDIVKEQGRSWWSWGKNKTNENIDSLKETAQDKSQEWKESAKDKSEELKEAAKDKSQEFKETAKDKSQKWGKDLKNTLIDTSEKAIDLTSSGLNSLNEKTQDALEHSNKHLEKKKD